MFHVIDVETGTVVRLLRTKQVAEFREPKRASAYAKKRGLKDGKKYKIKAVVEDTAWIDRETARSRDGTYVPVPFIHEVWYRAALGVYSAHDLGGPNSGYAKLIPLIGSIKHHFPHVSMTNKTMLAYTESPEKGARDIQTQIKPGAYLTKYFGSWLSAEDITRQVNNWQRIYADAELHFARTPEDIVAVYMSGPNSCMSGQPENYSGRDSTGVYHHPCEAYGQPHSDLTLAYIKGRNGVSSRTIVWEDKKLYGRVYGDSTLLARELKALGYRQAHGYKFDGAKVAKIDITRSRKSTERVYVMPYIDGANYVLDSGDHFLLDPRNGHGNRKETWVCCNNTNGTSMGEYFEMFECTDCGDEFDQRDARTHNMEPYCSTCFNERFAICARLGCYAPRNEMVEVLVRSRAGGHHPQQWCQEAVRQDAIMCPVMERLYSTRSCVCLGDGTTWISREAIDKHGGYFQCPVSQVWWPDSEGVVMDNGVRVHKANETAYRQMLAPPPPQQVYPWTDSTGSILPRSTLTGYNANDPFIISRWRYIDPTPPAAPEQPVPTPTTNRRR